MSPRVLSLLFGITLGACRPFAVPGLGQLVGPRPAPLVPEPMACGPGNYPEPRPLRPNQKIVGAADFHNHQFANLGFGGRVFWGSTYHLEGIEHALSACGVEDLCMDDREFSLCRMACAAASDRERCRAGCERARCSSSPPHGHFGVTDPIGAVLGQGEGHVVRGFPEFRGWPHYNTYTHQQEYYRWLRRAFDGGLKLVVVLAVTNEVLCRFLGHTHPCDDMTNVDLQLREAKKLERFIDWEGDCDGQNGNGWYRIAKTPEEARAIIQSGAMAVVLGIEVDTLFNCYQSGACSPESVERSVEHYRDLGVTHVFPVHVFDNAFGGTAAANDFFNFGSAVVNHDLLHVRDCSADGYTFRFGAPSTKVNGFLSSMAAHFGLEYPEYPKHGAHCNSRGLSALGRDAIKAMIDAKMLLDVDHMSTMTRKAALDVAKECAYPGLLSGHSGFSALNRGQKKSEGQLTDAELERLLEQGGLVAPILHQGDRSEIGAYNRPEGTKIAHDCSSSAKSFAQAYLFAVDAMKRYGGGRTAVGFGSDINGLAGMPAPRFGPYACGGDGEPQANRVKYPFPPLHGAVETMDQHQAGYRRFDINVDGFAQMGMFPDFIAELRAIGLSDIDLEPLFGSAEAYIDLWERARRQPKCP